MLNYIIKILLVACYSRGILITSVKLSPTEAIAEVDGNVTLSCSFNGSSVSTFWISSNTSVIPLITEHNNTCIASGFLNNPQLYSWKCLDNKTHSLTLKHVQRSYHKESWFCQVGRSKSNKCSIYIKVPVENVTLQSDAIKKPIQENQTVALLCYTSYSRPVPSVFWYLDSGTENSLDDVNITKYATVNYTQQHDNFSRDNESLVHSTFSWLIYSPKRSENKWGIYCLASNIVGKSRSSFKTVFNVTYPPASPVILGYKHDPYKVIENEMANVSCSVIGGNPLAVFSLICDISAEKTRRNETMRKDLMWNVTQEHSNKTCICQAVQINWNMTAKVTLEVLYPPEVPTITMSYMQRSETFSETFLKIIANESIELSCVTRSNPGPSYKWSGQGKTVETKVFEMKNISPSIKGVYTCHVSNTMHPTTGPVVRGIRNNSVNIDVLYAPEVSRLQNVSVIEGNRIILHCITKPGNPDSTIFDWTSSRDNGFRRGQQDIELTNVSRDSTGFYKCTASNTMKPTGTTEVIGKSNQSLHLTVLHPPNSPTIRLIYSSTNIAYDVSQKVDIIENETFTLTCAANGVPMPFSYHWTAPFQLLHHTDSELKIYGVKRYQNGKYDCRAKNTMNETSGYSRTGENSSFIQIDILYPPMIEEMNNVTVLEGKFFNKICKLEDPGNPKAITFLWTRAKNEQTMTGQNLQIQNVSRTDSTRYTCSVYNQMSSTFGNHTAKGESKKHFHLNVVYSATVKTFVFFSNEGKEISTVNETQAFQMTCIVDSNPAPMVLISFPNGQEKSENGRHNLSVVQHATCINAGTYKCTGMNMHNKNKGDVSIKNLFVRCPPRPSDIMSPKRTIITSARHDSASLSFTANPFYDPNPTTFAWKRMKDSQWRKISVDSNIRISNSDSQSNLTVAQMTESDYGEYLVIYSNSAGTNNYSFVIEAVAVTEHSQTSNLNMVVVVVITGIVVGVAAIVAVGLYCYRKRRSRTEGDRLIYQNVPINGKIPKTKKNTRNLDMEETSIDDLQEIDDVPYVTNEQTEYCNSLDTIAHIERIRVSELFSYVLGKSVDSFGADYHKLPTQLQMACTFARKPENIALNRYNGIYPYDHSRVTLNGQPDFFINACYINGYRKSKAYIASLGPTEKTTCGFKTFWQMVWYERSDVIVMLTNLMEPSGMKCEQYWPQKGTSKCYGDISVFCQTTDIFAEYTVRTLTLSKNEEHRSLTHLHYTAWPDKKIPEDTTSLIVFRQRMKATPTSSDGPIIIHCSAGIGRTGTLIALDMLIEEGQSEGSVNVYECVRSMREQRVKMVQTPEQYIYIYKALVNALTFDCEDIPVETFQEYVDTTNNNIYSRQFQQLRQSVETDLKEELEARSANEKLTNKNRSGADVPGNRSRVLLYLDRQKGESEYINAVYINSFKKKDSFIVAQTPLPSTVSDFICMIYQEACSCIITMEDFKEPGLVVGEYLPGENRSLNSGNFTVSCSRIETKQQYIVRKMNIKLNGKFDSGEKVVYHFQYTKWKNGNETPGNAIEFMQFVLDVDEYASQLGENRSHVLVHCLKANQRSGLFCAMSILMEQIEYERQVSVLNTLRHLRTRRQSAITSMEQLKFCYEAVSTYIKMHVH